MASGGERGERMAARAGTSADRSSRALSLVFLSVAVVALGVAAAVSCAESNVECRLNSECWQPGRCEQGRCERDCREDIDCLAGWCDQLGYCRPGINPDADADADADVRDDGRTDTDDGGDADADADADADGIYLDPCAAHPECIEGHCLADSYWGDSHCARECSPSTPGSCAYEHYCVEADATLAVCADAHMGLPCNPADPTANACAYGCVGVAGGGAHCTRPCTSAADCPGGYGCGYVHPAVPADGKVCMLVNVPCPTGNECPSGVGACGGAGSWCSAPCQTAADCPRLGAGVPSYTCAIDSGVGYNVCQLNDAMLPYIGENGLGTSCATNTDCRSGMCANDGTGASPYCIEMCTVRGGCPHGFGCVPFRTSSGGAYSLFCVTAGRRNVGETCANGADCRSGYCDASRCTRICNDGYCPTGTTCTSSGITADGTAIRVCR
jgi:hypothetical protein